MEINIANYAHLYYQRFIQGTEIENIANQGTTTLTHRQLTQLHILGMQAYLNAPVNNNHDEYNEEAGNDMGPRYRHNSRNFS